MAKGKVEKCSFVSEWEWQGKKNYNFVVKFEGSEDRFVYVGKDKDNPKFVVGQEAEYNIVEGKTIKVFVKDKTYEYPKIELVKQNNTFGGFGGGGGNKNYVKTPEQYKNELLGYIGGYAKDVIAHRVNLGKDAEEIITVYEKLVDGMFKALSKHIQ